MNGQRLALNRRLRVSPYEARSLPGVRRVSVYNHMVLPVVYETLEEDYWHLREHVQMWDVACQVQVEIRGPDALKLVEWMTPRDVSLCEPGQCIYVTLLDEAAGIINDPIVSCLAPDRYWLSVSDSDVLLWVKGLAQSGEWRVEVFDPNVFPMSVQGPKSGDLMSRVLGDSIRELGFFRFIETQIASIPVYVARTGWSGQGGFEIYLLEASLGVELWDALAAAGKDLNVRVGSPNLIDRIETGLLSYGSDMTLENNPLEVGLDRFFEMGKTADYLAREALEHIVAVGPARKLVRVAAKGEPVGLPRTSYALKGATGQEVGFVTSMVYSPRLEHNIGFGFVPSELAEVGGELDVVTSKGSQSATIVDDNWST
ncbi:MAG: dimethylsulfoniopropionate demethylase [Woeseiaceae bacterium]|nr:dimethylsulfoniopropionate demethylase [Woeseiaceae bacterium]NIP21154.1 dimethylsulfoniopropionate demethylase [Woeseiaceae bacterium]NIS90126.1 dimethylsulfoniopropionate demethylase [Woeseiaceae bacterium]